MLDARSRVASDCRHGPGCDRSADAAHGGGQIRDFRRPTAHAARYGSIQIKSRSTRQRRLFAVNWTRHRRRCLSAALLVALLVMQWATAAHACPVAHPTAPIVEMPDGCDGHMQPDPGHLQQCKAHCERASQALNAVQGVDVDAQPVMLAVVDWRLAQHAAPMRGRVESIVRSGAPPPGSLPLYLTLRVLRN